MRCFIVRTSSRPGQHHGYLLDESQTTSFTRATVLGIMDADEHYTKETWLWTGGEFVMPPSLSNDLLRCLKAAQAANIG